jgi:hypothetical protein
MYRSLQSNSFVASSPHLLLLAFKRRRIHALNPPQPTLRLVDMEFLVVPYICNVRFQDLTDSGCDSMICFVRIGLRDRDVVDDDSDERISCVRTAADVNVVASQFDEVHDDVECWQTSVGVHGCDVSRQSLFGSFVFERAGRVEDQPERHLDIR